MSINTFLKIQFQVHACSKGHGSHDLKAKVLYLINKFKKPLKKFYDIRNDAYKDKITLLERLLTN